MMLVGLWILRILVIMFIIRMIVRGLTRRRPAPAGRRSAPKERPGGALVQDPQCGTYIPLAKALTAGKGAGARHFCSSACRDLWVASKRAS